MKLTREETVYFVILTVAILSSERVKSQGSSPTWHRLDDAVYLVESSTVLSFDQAQSRCQEYESNLAKVDSDEIQAFLTTFVTPPLQDTRCFRIGATDRVEEDQFKWLDGTLVTYDGWAPSQPDNNGNNQDCACLWSSRREDIHGQWDDDRCSSKRNFICQRGLYDFEFITPRTNPGFALVYCAVDVDSEGETLFPDDVKLSIGQTLSSSRPISFSSTSRDGEFRNNSYLLGNLSDTDQIFCYVGELPSQLDSFSLATLSPEFNFYALPQLTTGPIPGEITSSSIAVFWSHWTSSFDSGDGPVVGYLVYQQPAGEDWTEAGGIDSGLEDGDPKRIIEFLLTGLDPGTEYNISVSAVREGSGGEGPRGPLVSVKTTSYDGSAFQEDSRRVWIALFLVSFLGNLILLAVLLIICKWKQKKQDLSHLRAAPIRAGGGGARGSDPKSSHYELPQQSGVRHEYQGLKVTGSSADEYQCLKMTGRSADEQVYADIEDPEKNYINIPS
ncbi:uncharacterized protein LOC129271086 isoform X1 [Lytechinus pictus]|uniref:uncharacterized protein LOC129271086 isoform X1 n=1 Tax=Lytechinus pictus TaxID=7653 RepID=UPI0030B9C34F